MALPLRPPYSNPIPNNPFYSPLEWYIHGPNSPLIVGAGLFVSTEGTISSGGGGGAVSGIYAGAGINVNTNIGNVTVTNTGVTLLTAGSGISLTGNTGNITINNTLTGTVSLINTGAGLKIGRAHV